MVMGLIKDMLRISRVVDIMYNPVSSRPNKTIETDITTERVGSVRTPYGIFLTVQERRRDGNVYTWLSDFKSSVPEAKQTEISDLLRRKGYEEPFEFR